MTLQLKKQTEGGVYMKHALLNLSEQLLSPEKRHRIERFTLMVAIASFLVHLAIILLAASGLIEADTSSQLLSSPISALYTPFSFILVYEVYLLIFYLPKSLSTYINKQYEIILLIIMRRLFKDLANLKMSSDWFTLKYDLQFTYDLISTLLLFYLIYVFSTQSKRRFTSANSQANIDEGTQTYARIKSIIASGLVPLVFILAIYSFVDWLVGSFTTGSSTLTEFHGINRVFFEQFFTLLVIVDVILLLVSFFHTDKFHVIIRNSGFIISTILIRMSFTVEGVVNNILVVAAVLFGLLIQLIYNKYEQSNAD